LEACHMNRVATCLILAGAARASRVTFDNGATWLDLDVQRSNVYYGNPPVDQVSGPLVNLDYQTLFALGLLTEDVHRNKACSFDPNVTGWSLSPQETYDGGYIALHMVGADVGCIGLGNFLTNSSYFRKISDAGFRAIAYPFQQNSAWGVNFLYDVFDRFGDTAPFRIPVFMISQNQIFPQLIPNWAPLALTYQWQVFPNTTIELDNNGYKDYITGKMLKQTWYREFICVWNALNAFLSILVMGFLLKKQLLWSYTGFVVFAEGLACSMLRFFSTMFFWGSYVQYTLRYNMYDWENSLSISSTFVNALQWLGLVLTFTTRKQKQMWAFITFAVSSSMFASIFALPSKRARSTCRCLL